MKMRIKSISVEGFRGLLGVHNYELNGKSLLLFAQNGMCKSSLIDAIDYFRSTKVNGQLGHLNAREYGGVKTLKHLNKLGDGNVTISFTEDKDGARKVTENGGPPPAIASFISQISEYDWIFRLEDITKVLDAAPGERYENIANAIGILPLMNISKKMDAVKKWSLDNPYESQKKIILQEITKLIGANMNDIDEQLFINKLCEKYMLNYNMKFLDNLNELELKVKEHKNDIKDQTGVKNAELALYQIDQVLSDVEKINNQQLNLKTAEQEIKELKLHSGAVILFKLLEASNEYLHDHQPENCPICESENINWELQKERISDELLRNESYNKLSKKVEELRKDKQTTEKSLGLSLSKAQKTLSIIMSESKVEKLAASAIELNTMSIEELNSALVELSQLLITFVSNSTSATNLESLVNLERDIEGIKRLIESYGLLTVKKGIYSTFASQIVATAESFSQFCINEMDSRFSKVVERAQEIFSEMVDNPTLESGISVANSFKVVPIKAREITLLMNYLGKEGIVPSGYLNESWKRAYGLGLIFSLIEKGNQSFPVLVLDDVFSSFDFPNQRRIANFLAENFKHIQLIITTHDSHFHKCMKEAIYRHNGNGWNTIEAFSYNRSLGQVSYKNSLSDLEEIDDLLKTAVKATSLANPIRIFFEDWCRIHCDLLSVSLPFKGEISGAGYTHGELWPPLQSSIKTHFSGNQESLNVLIEIQKSITILLSFVESYSLSRYKIL